MYAIGRQNSGFLGDNMGAEKERAVLRSILERPTLPSHVLPSVVGHSPVASIGSSSIQPLPILPRSSIPLLTYRFHLAIAPISRAVLILLHRVQRTWRLSTAHWSPPMAIGRMWSRIKECDWMPALIGTGSWNLLMAPGTFPLLLQQDKPPHLANGGPLVAPVLRTARGPAADSFNAGRILGSLAAADGAGSSCKALLFFRGVGIPAVFADEHFC